MSLEDLPKELLLLVLGLGLIGIGVFVYKNNPFQPSVAVQVLSTSTQIGQSASKDVYVDISGAVNAPGVYKMAPESRVEDVLTQAQGFTANADTKWIETYLNRAIQISDGLKIYIPRTGESPKVVQGGKTNINSASQGELEALPGIGAVYAVKIISNRPYSRNEDLMSKEVVGEKLFSRIKDFITP